MGKDDDAPGLRNITEARATIGALLRGPYDVLAGRIYGGLAREGFADVRRAHSPVFRHIAPSGSRLTDLAELAGITKQSMAYLVEGLVAGGYAATSPDPQDGRARLVRLTAKGRRVQDALLRLGAEAEAECARAIGAEDYARLRMLLGRLMVALEPEAADRLAVASSREPRRSG